MDPTGDQVHSTIQFGVKLVVYFCVHKHFRQRRAMEWSLQGTDDQRTEQDHNHRGSAHRKMCSIYDAAKAKHISLDPATFLEVVDKSQRYDEHCQDHDVESERITRPRLKET